MNKLPTNIQDKFLKIVNGEIAVEAFEEWIYEHPELDKNLEKADYLKIISMDFKDEDIIQDLRKIMYKYFDYGDPEKWRLDKITVLKRFLITENGIEELSKEAKSTAIGCWKKWNNDNWLSPETWDLFDEISTYLWESANISMEEKVSLGFELFEIFPSYYHFLVPYYHVLQNNELENTPELKVLIWNKLAQYLSSENYYSDTVSYVLWCDFFEDQSTVKESWEWIMRAIKNDKWLALVIESAWPVPFELKEPIYQRLIHNQSYHQSIFNSLLHSAYDYFWKINTAQAKKILKKLKVDSSTSEYKLLKEKLNWTILDNLR